MWLTETGRNGGGKGASSPVINGMAGRAEMARGEPPASSACRRKACFTGTAIGGAGAIWRGARRTFPVMLAISKRASVVELIVSGGSRAQDHTIFSMQGEGLG